MANTLAIFLAILLAIGWPVPASAQSESSTRSLETRRDGLIAASPESQSVVPKPLRDMDSAIRAGEFKKIGSVLVARRGKLVFEDYFEGEVGTLRDTRSATKSITDVLVGIAVGEKKLGSIDARVLALLPERARKVQNPDPRKDKITVEDLLTMSSPLECDDGMTLPWATKNGCTCSKIGPSSSSICRFGAACMSASRPTPRNKADISASEREACSP